MCEFPPFQVSRIRGPVLVLQSDDGSRVTNALEMFQIIQFIRFCRAFLWHGIKIYFVSKRRGEEENVLRIAKLQSCGGAAICRALNISVYVNGRLPSGKPMLIVSNHPGILDPWILSSRLVVSFVAKIEMSRWPVFGPIGRACGLLFADRENRMRTSDLIGRIQDRMRDGVAVLVFPEGTTSGQDKVLPFKSGAFAAVEKMPGAIVLPIYMWVERIEGEDSNEATRKKIFWPRGMSLIKNANQVLAIKSLDMEILVGAPIETDKYDRKELAVIAQNKIETLENVTRQNSSPLASRLR